MMIHIGSGDYMIELARRMGKHVDQAVADATQAIKQSRCQLLPWQSYWLYALASRIDRLGGRALEIGTALGYSAYLIARAMPHTKVFTLNPNGKESALAQAALTPLGVLCFTYTSLDFLRINPYVYDFIFVDGDHARVACDLPWFNRLTPGGLMLFHDYSPHGPHACPPVYEAVNGLAASLGRSLDVVLMDDGGTGMAGMYHRAGETL